MFSFLTERKDYLTLAKEYIVPKTPTNPPSNQKQQEFYRVGVTENGQTTLTILSHDGFSTTMTMTQSSAEQLIRMIQSTFPAVNESKNK